MTPAEAAQILLSQTRNDYQTAIQATEEYLHRYRQAKALHNHYKDTK